MKECKKKNSKWHALSIGDKIDVTVHWIVESDYCTDHHKDEFSAIVIGFEYECGKRIILIDWETVCLQCHKWQLPQVTKMVMSGTEQEVQCRVLRKVRI